MTLQTAKGPFSTESGYFCGKNTMKKQPVHIIFDKILNSSEEATNYANSRGFKITHIEKYFMKGTHVFLYKFTKSSQSNERTE